MSHDDDSPDTTTGESDPLFVAIHDLVTRILDGTATATDHAGLEDLVSRSPEARRLYVAYMRETAVLRWRHAAAAVDLGAVEAAMSPPRTWATALFGSHPVRAWAALALAAAVLLGFAFFRPVWGPKFVPEDRVADASPEAAERPPAPAAATSKPGPWVGVATLTHSTDVVWSDPAERREELSRVGSGEVLRIDRGSLELVFDAGVQMLIRGPAKFEVRAADYAIARLGTISARVGEHGRGFTIETPTARVVDLGTEFGVAVAPSGATEVAVFHGLVDLSVSRDAPPRRLRQGEALRVGADGSLARVMAISSDRFPEAVERIRAADASPAVIGSVSDDNGDVGSHKFYKIVRGGLREDAQAFVDRNHQWNGVTSVGMPAFLRGLDYVMPYNDDKFADDLHVSVDLTQPATLYVLYSDSLPVPEWLRRDFIDTGDDIGLDEAKNRYVPTRRTASGPGASIDTVFSVWRRDVAEPTTVILGAVQVPVGREGYNMYGIAAGPPAPRPNTEGTNDDGGS